MICRKCGAALPDNAIRCSHCGIKVNMICPECKTLNAFGTKFCNSCGFELIKTCPKCHCSNVYSAERCRKCDTLLSQDNNEPILQNEEPINDIVRPISCYETSLTASAANEEIVNPIHEDIEQPITVEEEQEETLQQNIEIPRTVSQEEINEPEIQDTESDSEQNENAVKDVEDILPEDIEIQPLEEVVDIDVQDSLDENEYQEEQNEENEIPPDEQEIEYDKVEVQKETVKKTINIIKNSIDKHIISITGEEGSGKSAVLKQAANILLNQGYTVLYGNCTPLSQITSFGFFQDAFLRLMGFPPYTNSSEAFTKDFQKSDFVHAFSFLKGNELTLFLNIFYPSLKDNFENILNNKQVLFTILEKVLKSFLVGSNLVIIIDNFELLDGASYDFIVYLLNKGSFNNRLKLLTAYQENKSIQSYFETTRIEEKIFETICLKKFNKQELIDSANESIGIDITEILPSTYLEQIIQRSDGNAIRMEQEIAFLFDTKYINVENNQIFIQEENKPYKDPESLEDLIKLRINSLPPSAKNVLFMAAIMGYRFATGILCLSVTMPEEKAVKTLEFLKQELFIIPVDNFTCEFKNLTIWKLIYQEAKADLLFKENSQHLYATLRPLILSSNLQKLISCQEALTKKEEFIIWQDMTSLTAKLGDTNLFVIAQKQSLKILEEENIPNAENIRAVIYEQIGKLLSEKSPSEAVTYLANVLDSEIKAQNINNIIDLSGYFINSCYLTGNFFGAAEAVDTIISSLSETSSKVSDVDIALIKTRKLKALLNIGNSEQIINIIQEEILPDLEKALNNKNIDSAYKNILIDAWLKSATILAKAFAIQGHNSVYDVIGDINQFLEKYNYDTEYYITQTELIEAFADSTRGKLINSNEILSAITNRYKDKLMATNLLAEWNLINIINKVFANQNDGLKADLFEIAAFTNNINEHLIKNIIKLILGYILQEEGNTKKALCIFNEEITYFAKEKVAIGALLAWALIVRISIDTGDIEKSLNTATKALEIAQSPKINNFFFSIYFQRFIAEIYLIKGDLIAVKMYLEKAIMLAKQYNLKYQLVDLYIDYGKYMEEMMNSTKNYTEDYTKLTADMYNKAVMIAKELNISSLTEKAVKERAAFKTYCQLNSIDL